MSEEKYDPAEKFGGPAFEGPVDIKVYEDLIENMPDDSQEVLGPLVGAGELLIHASGTGPNRNFKQAVSWLFHSEHEDEVQQRFELTDQQLVDAINVVNMFARIHREGANEDFDIYDEVHKWSNK